MHAQHTVIENAKIKEENTKYRENKFGQKIYCDISFERGYLKIQNEAKSRLL